MTAAPGRLLKRALLAFWAVYFSLVTVSNLVDLLGELGALDWTFLDSGNADYLRSVVEVYGIGSDLTLVLLAGACAIELAAALLFWRALRRGDTGAALLALAGATLVWAGFIFMTELFVAYTSESPFRELLMLTIGTALVVALVPDQPVSAAVASR